jgi:tetratricopeptide (TPR) repeat protein
MHRLMQACVRRQMDQPSRLLMVRTLTDTLLFTRLMPEFELARHCLTLCSRRADIRVEDQGPFEGRLVDVLLGLSVTQVAESSGTGSQGANEVWCSAWFKEGQRALHDSLCHENPDPSRELMAALRRLPLAYTMRGEVGQALKWAWAWHEWSPSYQSTAALATCYIKIKDSVRARRYIEEALKLRTSSDEDAGVADLYVLLMEVCIQEQKWDDAEMYGTRALGLRQGLPEDHPRRHREVAHVLEKLGLMYRSCKRYSKSTAMYVMALRIREDALDPGDHELAMSHFLLGALQEEQEHYRPAEYHYKRALAVWESADRGASVRAALGYIRLGVLYSKMGQKYENFEVFAI